MMIGSPLCVTAAVPSWEQVSTINGSDSDPERVDVTVRDGYIYITIQRQTQVKLFSILGQLISQKTLAGGTSRLKVPARGIYILKVGSVTRRVTV
jgi:hypothetical protein